MLRKINPSSIIKILEERYPEAKCSLQYKNPLELLIATILSAQCTDERVNKVTKSLFKSYPTLTSFIEADLQALEQQIYSTGFYKNKAKNIQQSCLEIQKEHAGMVPKNMEALLTLPGVARKTANVVLGNAYGICAGIVVDTHIGRLARRFGWSPFKQAEKVEKDLMQIIPKNRWISITHQMIWHGRALCKARRPNCGSCFLSHLCPSCEVKDVLPHPQREFDLSRKGSESKTVKTE